MYSSFPNKIFRKLPLTYTVKNRLNSSIPHIRCRSLNAKLCVKPSTGLLKGQHYFHWSYLEMYLMECVSLKQPSRGAHRKRYSGNMQQNYKRTPMPKFYFNQVEKFSKKVSVSLKIQLTFYRKIVAKKQAFHFLLFFESYVMRCLIQNHLYNLRAYNFTKSNTPPGVFFLFFKLYKWYQIAQNIRT